MGTPCPTKASFPDLDPAPGLRTPGALLAALRPLPSWPRFSGVTEADLADTSISLRDVQAVLLSLFSADTILIGHSLESDLLALKVSQPPPRLDP